MAERRHRVSQCDLNRAQPAGGIGEIVRHVEHLLETAAGGGEVAAVHIEGRLAKDRHRLGVDLLEPIVDLLFVGRIAADDLVFFLGVGGNRKH